MTPLLAMLTLLADAPQPSATILVLSIVSGLLTLLTLTGTVVWAVGKINAGLAALRTSFDGLAERVCAAEERHERLGETVTEHGEDLAAIRERMGMKKRS